LEDIIVDGAMDVYSTNLASLVRVNGGTFRMEEGAVLRNNRAQNGGGVLINGGTFTMNGGTISGNAAPTGSSSGGGVYFSFSAFTMNGGSIINNTANNGGGVSHVGGNSSIFTMNGGAISGNRVTSATGSGGGVSINSTGTLNLNGGEISGNFANNGGGVSVGGVNFRVGGTGKVRDNFMLNETTLNNARLAGVNYLILGTGAANHALLPVATGDNRMEIHVTVQTTGNTIIEIGASSEHAPLFRSDDGRQVMFNAGRLFVQ